MAMTNASAIIVAGLGIALATFYNGNAQRYEVVSPATKAFLYRLDKLTGQVAVCVPHTEKIKDSAPSDGAIPSETNGSRVRFVCDGFVPKSGYW